MKHIITKAFNIEVHAILMISKTLIENNETPNILARKDFMLYGTLTYIGKCAKCKVSPFTTHSIDTHFQIVVMEISIIKFWQSAAITIISITIINLL